MRDLILLATEKEQLRTSEHSLQAQLFLCRRQLSIARASEGFAAAIGSPSLFSCGRNRTPNLARPNGPADLLRSKRLLEVDGARELGKLGRVPSGENLDSPLPRRAFPRLPSLHAALPRWAGLPRGAGFVPMVESGAPVEAPVSMDRALQRLERQLHRIQAR